MTSPDPVYTRVRLTARQWAECAVIAVLLVAATVCGLLALSRIIDSIGSGPALRNGQSTWSPEMDRRRG